MNSKFEKYKNFALTTGSHASLAEGACVMELAAHIAGEAWSDAPECVCPVLAAACRTANDAGPDWVRDALRDRIPKLIESAGASAGAVEIERAVRLAWFAIRVAAPAALRGCGLGAHADQLCEAGTLHAAHAAAAAAAADAHAAYAADAVAGNATSAAWAAAHAAAAAAATAATAAHAADAADAARAATHAVARAADAADIWHDFLQALDEAVALQ